MATMKKALKAVDKSKKPGLAKLPTEVRNKMGYQKEGGQTPTKKAPKMVPGEMTGKMYKKSEIDEIGKKQAAELDKSGVFGKAAMAKKKAPKAKNGMIKRADGSYSKRGLWDNIRAAKGSGKKPTAAMLKQEKKIKAKTKK
jgi:hypothetical protein